MSRSQYFFAFILASLVPALAEAQPHWEDWYLYSDKANLYVTEIGRGDTVVVLHGGWGSEHSYLLDAVSELEWSFHFVLYDQRGSLRSPSPDSLISVRQHVADLEALRRTLGLERMTLMAHSMGTFLAMSYLDAYPDRVGRIVLAAAIPPKLDTLSLAPEALAFMERPAIEEQIEKEGIDVNRIPNTKENSKVWKIRFAGANIYHIDRWSQMKGGRIFYSQSANEAATRSMPRPWDFTPRLAEHDYPITVILGDHDFADWKGTRWLSTAAAIPHLHVVLLERAGHNAWIDRPYEFTAALAAGLEEAESRIADTE